MRSDRRGLWIGLGIVALLVLLGPLAHGFGGWPGPHPVGMGAESAPWTRGDGFGGPLGPHGFGFGFGGPMTLLVWALVIGGVIMLSRNGWSFRRAHAPETPASAEDLLRWRYAAGEISREEYIEMSRVVRGTPDERGTEPAGSA